MELTDRYRRAYQHGQKVVVLSCMQTGRIKKIWETKSGVRFDVGTADVMYTMLSKADIEDYDIWTRGNNGE